MSLISGQCAWCPWDCPSPSVAACRTNEPDPVPAPIRDVPSVLAGVCEPRWATERGRLPSGRKRSTVDVIRDLADYEAATNS